MIILFSVLYFFKLNQTLLFSLVLFILITSDFLAYLGLKKMLSSWNKKYKDIVSLIFWIISLLLYILLFWAFFLHKWNKDIINAYYLSNYITILYIPKIIFIPFYFIQLIVNYLNNFIIKKQILKKDKFNTNYRYNILLFIGFVFSFLILLMLLYGFLIGRFHFNVTNNTLVINDLPPSFENIKVVQISDLHISTFNKNEDKIDRIVTLINKQNPDLVFFTGDLINNFAEEAERFCPALRQIQARIGKYAVFGNHDYSDYYHWKNEQERIKNHLLLIKYIDSTGFKLLQNEKVAIVKNNDTIDIAGTENWGHLPYREEGNLNKTIQGTNKNSFILLLTHDPVFWEKFVKGHQNIKITFSGHTHGMQFGIRIGQFEWTPFHFKYNKRAGLYRENEQLLYVNRGLGGGLCAGRFGIWPEISVFELISNKKTK